MRDEFELSRRKMLAGLGTVGAASAGAGMGTSAFFSDTEEFDANSLVAGELDLKVVWQEHYSDWSEDEMQAAPDARMVDSLSDVDLGNEFPLPVPTDPMLAVPHDQFWDYWDVTSIDAYPDTDGDGIWDYETRQEVSQNNPWKSPSELDQIYRDQFTDVPDFFEDTGRRPLIDLGDVKPGDFGEVTFGVHLFDNPGYIWLNGVLENASENGTTEPEAGDGDEVDGIVELLDEIRVLIWHDDGNNVLNTQSDGSWVELVDYNKPSDGPYSGQNVELWNEDAIIASGTLRSVLELLSTGRGIQLDADPRTAERNCFPNSVTRFFGFAWYLPVDHANEIQSDSVTFDLGFYTEQCRHNDGSGQGEGLIDLGSAAAQNTGFAATGGDGYTGSGYWTDDPNQTNQDGGNYEQLYVTFQESFGPYYVDSLATFTVGDIESIRYRTRRPQGATQDYFMEIFTFPDGTNDDASWYGRQLQTLPGDALNKDVSPNEWLTWRTESGPNQLTFYDYNHDYDTTDGNDPPYLGQDTGVTLADLQSTASFDWSNPVSTADSTPKNYRDEEVRALRFATGSAWQNTHEGDLDAIEIRLKDGREALVDLEP